MNTDHPRRATPLEREKNIRALGRMRCLFPRLPKKDTVAFLINLTAFPFNTLSEAVDQAAELSVVAHKSVERAYHESWKQERKSMRYIKRKYPEHFKTDDE